MNILLTGASRGIGYATALRLLAEGEHHVMVLSRDEERLQGLARAAADAFGDARLRYLVYDLTQPDPKRLLPWLQEAGPLDALVNNAGLLINKPFDQLTADDWYRTFAANLFGVVDLIRLLLPHFRPDRPSHIVNISSMGGFQGSAKFPGLTAYSASKAALANLTECLAEELKDQQIKVNCLAIGAVQTEMLAAAFPGYEAPLNSEDMARFFAWFIQQGHHFFNGKILPVSVSTP